MSLLSESFSRHNPRDAKPDSRGTDEDSGQSPLLSAILATWGRPPQIIEYTAAKGDEKTGGGDEKKDAPQSNGTTIKDGAPAMSGGVKHTVYKTVDGKTVLQSGPKSEPGEAVKVTEFENGVPAKAAWVPVGITDTFSGKGYYLNTKDNKIYELGPVNDPKTGNYDGWRAHPQTNFKVVPSSDLTTGPDGRTLMDTAPVQNALTEALAKHKPANDPLEPANVNKAEGALNKAALKCLHEQFGILAESVHIFIEPRPNVDGRPASSSIEYTHDGRKVTLKDGKFMEGKTEIPASQVETRITIAIADLSKPDATKTLTERMMTTGLSMAAQAHVLRTAEFEARARYGNGQETNPSQKAHAEELLRAEADRLAKAGKKEDADKCKNLADKLPAATYDMGRLQVFGDELALLRDVQNRAVEKALEAPRALANETAGMALYEKLKPLQLDIPPNLLTKPDGGPANQARIDAINADRVQANQAMTDAMKDWLTKQGVQHSVEPGRMTITFAGAESRGGLAFSFKSGIFDPETSYVNKDGEKVIREGGRFVNEATKAVVPAAQVDTVIHVPEGYRSNPSKLAACLHKATIEHTSPNGPGEYTAAAEVPRTKAVVQTSVATPGEVARITGPTAVPTGEAREVAGVADRKVTTCTIEKDGTVKIDGETVTAKTFEDAIKELDTKIKDREGKVDKTELEKTELKELQQQRQQLEQAQTKLSTDRKGALDNIAKYKSNLEEGDSSKRSRVGALVQIAKVIIGAF